MKNNIGKSVAFICMLVFISSVNAQTGYDSGTPYGHGEDSVRCIRNTSLYSTYFDNKDYDMALRFWRQVIKECPASSKNIYIKGEAMYKELCRRTGDTAYLDTVLSILDQRTLLFNDKPSNDLRKAMALYELGGNDSARVIQSYSLIKTVADSFPENIDHSFSVLLMATATRCYALDLAGDSLVLNAYNQSMAFIESQLAARPGNTRYIEAGKSIDAILRSGGALTCSNIEKLYDKKLDQNLRDTALVRKVFRLLRETGCTTSDLYYKTATKLFAADRSAENAVRLAELNVARNSMDKAVWYYAEAIKLDTNRLVRSDILTRVAAMELAKGDKVGARNHAEEAFRYNSKNGNALFIIAEAYAGAKIGDAFDNHSVYWICVDYLSKAKAVDPSLKERADERIKAYAKLFPTREEGFFRSINDEGVTYTVGGWINETTVIRFRKE